MPAAQSSFIMDYELDPERGIVTVSFLNGAVYEYDGVPLDVFNEWTRNGGTGEYFWAKIRNSYPTRLVAGGRRH